MLPLLPSTAFLKWWHTGQAGVLPFKKIWGISCDGPTVGIGKEETFSTCKSELGECRIPFMPQVVDDIEVGLPLEEGSIIYS